MTLITAKKQEHLGRVTAKARTRWNGITNDVLKLIEHVKNRRTVKNETLSLAARF